MSACKLINKCSTNYIQKNSKAHGGRKRELSKVPTLSVCIPAYNRQHVIRQAIESVLSQDFTDFELIILDDGSTDDTLTEVAQITDPRIRIERNGQNLGIPASRQNCLNLARGKYLAWLDSDDIMAPKRLSRQVNWLDRHPETASLGGWVKTFHDDNAPGKLLIKPLTHAHLAAWLLFRCCHANTSLMARTAVMKQFGFRQAFPVSEDYDLSVRLSSVHKVANLPFVLTHQRQHSHRTTNLNADRNFPIKSLLAKTQFDQLGLKADEDDLTLHYALTRLTKDDVIAEDFVTRSSKWLSNIAAANEISRVYDADALADVLKIIWTQACLKIRQAKGAYAAYAAYHSVDSSGRFTRFLRQNASQHFRSPPKRLYP